MARPGAVRTQRGAVRKEDVFDDVRGRDITAAVHERGWREGPSRHLAAGFLPFCAGHARGWIPGPAMGNFPGDQGLQSRRVQRYGPQWTATRVDCLEYCPRPGDPK